MKRILFFIAVFFYGIVCYSQIDYSKLSFKAGFDIYANLKKEKTYNEGDFSFPCFYNNMNIPVGLSLELNYELVKRLSLGVEASLFKFNKWQYKSLETYSGAEADITLFTVSAKYSGQLLKINSESALKYYIKAGPSAGNATIILPYSPHSIVKKDSKSNTGFFSVCASGGLEIDINGFLGLYLETGINKSFIKVPTNLDTGFMLMHFELGIVLSDHRNKYYKY
jgi:hypothetical protein